MADLKLIKAGKNTLKNFIPQMKSILAFIFLFSISHIHIFSQDGTETSEPVSFFTQNAEVLLILFLLITFAILVFGIVLISDRLVRISAKEIQEKKGLSEEETERRFSMAPKIKPDIDWNRKKVIRLKEGHDISIKGKPELKTNRNFTSNTYTVKPIDFIGMSPIPKVMVEAGAEIKAGDPLFFDKKRPEIIYASPVSGEFVRIERGEKRVIEEIVILGDKEMKFKDFGKEDPNNMDRAGIVDKMIKSGLWPHLRQRPYNIVPNPDESPKMIYISCFNTAPLAGSYDYQVEGNGIAFQAGIDALSKLTDGGVHLGLNAKTKHSNVFLNVRNTVNHWFQGPHPAGNTGIQIHHISPINKGEQVWYMKPQDVVILGRLFTEGVYNSSKKVAVGGSEIKNPHYVDTYIGANVENLLKDNVSENKNRIIGGDVLTGKKIKSNGHIGFFDDLVSVIKEGDDYELFGWLLPSYPRPTVSPTFLSFFFHGEELEVNTNTHGEERPFVVTGLYETLLPMDIYPMQLMKSIITEDFEKMEGLGIYEVDEEDFALCEFACPSKTGIQDIIRQGLDLARAEG